jgi:tricorn protease
MFKRILCATAWLAALLPLCASQAAGPLVLSDPALSATHIAFAHAGQIWTVPRDGGRATRLVTGQSANHHPVYSPDGRLIAYAGTYNGNTDVYVVPAEGGEPRRLTYYPGPDEPLGFTADGRQILIRSMRGSVRDLPRFYLLPVNGGLPSALPIPTGEDAGLSPDGQHLAYTPFNQWQPNWKKYRGGQTARVWIADLATSKVQPIPRENSNDHHPVYAGQDVYFLSDREGTTTMYRFDGHAVERVVENSKGPDLTGVSAGPGAIAYTQFGSLHLYDLTTHTSRRVPVDVRAETTEARARFEAITPDSILSSALSANGKRLYLETHGEIVSVPADKGDVRNLTKSPGVADRSPAPSPDGRSVAWFSDESGEYALHIGSPDGLGSVRRIALGEPPSFFYAPTWSPDSKKIAYTDKRLNLWLLDLDHPTPVKVDTDRYNSPLHHLDPAWSPDSQTLVYTKQLPSRLHAAYAYNLPSRQIHALTDGTSDVRSPKFDGNGAVLYFIASTDEGVGSGWLDMSSLGHARSAAVYAMVLSADGQSPMAPQSDEDGDSKPADAAKVGKDGKSSVATTRIDYDGIAMRVVRLPIPVANYRRLEVGVGALYVLKRPVADSDSDLLSDSDGASADVVRYDTDARKSAPWVSGVELDTFQISADGHHMAYQQAGKWVIADAGKEPKAGDGLLNLESAQLWIDPRAEWRQIYHETWRIERDFLYDPNAHGLDLAKAERAYAPFLEGLTSRADLSALMREMTGHIGLGHTFINGGRSPVGPRVSVGMLGADYAVVDGHVQISRVLLGDPWSTSATSPLTQPGAVVKAGEFLLAVDGRPVDASEDVYRHFEGLAGRQVRLTVGPRADGQRARQVTVVPVANETALRLADWMERNRRLVDAKTDGRVAYVYLPDTASGGFPNFNRYFYSQVGKDAVIIDERFNHGGDIADFIVDQLKKTPQMINHTREGEDTIEPAQAIFGPKVMIINEMSGSGGDALPWLFKKAKLGPLVGTRTWGGLVGIHGYPPLIDGGSVTAPHWAISGTDGAWEVENNGIAPTITVEQDPSLMRDGGDPQLNAAIDAALGALKNAPGLHFPRPAAPDFKPVIPSFDP